MSDIATITAPTITTRDVEDWCAVADVRQGRKYLQNGAVLRPWVSGSTIHAEVQGSGTTPYRIDITFKDSGSKPSPKCTCPAFRRNPFCKHVATVLLAWSTRPATFAAVEAPPAEAKAPPARAKKARADAPGTTTDTPGHGKTEEKAGAARTALVESGLAQATDLLTELCARGLLAITPEQADAVLKLAELLISQKLNRLGRAIQRISNYLRQVSTAKSDRRGSQPEADVTAFAALLADAWFILAATKHALQADQATAESSGDFEDLLGTRFDESRLSKSICEAVLEIGFEEETNDIKQVIGTSYLLDLSTGELMLERKIVPERLAERERKRPYQSLLLNCEIASSRSQPPRRVKVTAIGQRQPFSAEALARATRHAITTVAVLRRRLAAQIADPLAPRELLALFAPEALQVIDAPPSQSKSSQSLLLIDAEGIALPVDNASTAKTILDIVTHQSIAAFFGRLKLNKQKDALVFAPLSVLCPSGTLHMIG